MSKIDDTDEAAMSREVDYPARSDVAAGLDRPQNDLRPLEVDPEEVQRQFEAMVARQRDVLAEMLRPLAKAIETLEARIQALESGTVTRVEPVPTWGGSASVADLEQRLRHLGIRV